MSRTALAFAAVLATGAAAQPADRAPRFAPVLAGTPDRVWVGSSFFACRLQDWRLSGGRIECVEGRPRWVDPEAEGPRQYPGWPRTFPQRDGDGRTPQAYLPRLRVLGMTDPVVQAFDGDELVWALRIAGHEVRPWVYRDGEHRVVVGEPADRVRTLTLRPTADADAVVEVDLRHR